MGDTGIKTYLERPLGYAVAFAAVAVAAFVRFSVDPWVGNQYAFATQFGAIAVTVWAAGIGPALVALALGYLVSNYFFIAPRGELALSGVDDLYGLLAYLISASLIVAIGEALRRARTRAKRDQASLDVAVGAANMVAYDLDVATMTARRSDNAPNFYGTDLSVPTESMTRHIHPEDQPRFRESLKAALEAGDTYFSEFRLIRPRDQRLMWLQSHGRVFRDETGKATRICGVVMDTTQRVLLEHELIEKTKFAHRTSQRKSDFIAMLAHELRNPLAPIKGAVDLVAHPAISESSRERALQVLQRQVAAMERLIEDLLDVNRIEQGKITLQPEQVDVARLMRDALEAAAPHIGAKAQSLSTQLPGEPVWVCVDAGRIVQVLSNLLNNASKFTPREGAIVFAARQQGAEALISVKDTGAGIAREHLKSIFEAFFQLVNASARGNSGLGIGLSLSQALVAMHGGRIEAKSDGPGQGSEFVVRLPLMAERKQD